MRSIVAELHGPPAADTALLVAMTPVFDPRLPMLYVRCSWEAQ
jgi:hypothetical protein